MHQNAALYERLTLQGRASVQWLPPLRSVAATSPVPDKPEPNREGHRCAFLCKSGKNSIGKEPNLSEAHESHQRGLHSLGISTCHDCFSARAPHVDAGSVPDNSQKPSQLEKLMIVASFAAVADAFDKG
jgi:hypothetical protein